jgi:hypothetical protein
LLFLCFQMFQQTRITISIKQGPENFLVALFSISGPEFPFQSIRRYVQMRTLNVHSKNKWDESS